VAAELTRLTAHAMAAALLAGEASAVDLATTHLDRIEAEDAGLHAWLHVDRDGALADARRADELARPGRRPWRPSTRCTGSPSR
jgi:aspartyl-tRNA(Asn)/glutamyl-tRNA(Gln) amidotransferase subunit A